MFLVPISHFNLRCGANDLRLLILRSGMRPQLRPDLSLCGLLLEQKRASRYNVTCSNSAPAYLRVAAYPARRRRHVSTEVRSGTIYWLTQKTTKSQPRTTSDRSSEGCQLLIEISQRFGARSQQNDTRYCLRKGTHIYFKEYSHAEVYACKPRA